MPIVIRHDAAGGLIGAYAAGQAARQRRGQKYAMEMLLQNLRHRQRMQELGARRGVGRGAGQVEGRWTDPLALGQRDEQGQLIPTDVPTAVKKRAEQRARARKYRLGQGIPDKWQPTFMSQEQIERNQELADEKRRRELALKDEERERQQELDDTAWQFHLKGIDARIPPIPEHLVGTEHESKLRRLNDAEREARSSHRYNPEQRQEAVEKIQAEREKYLREVAPPPSTPDEKYHASLRFRNPQTRMLSRERGEGFTEPGRLVDGEFITDPQWTASQEAAGEADTARAAMKEQLDTLEGKINQAQMALDKANRDGLTEEYQKPYKDEVRRLKDKRDQLVAEIDAAAQGSAGPDSGEPPQRGPYGLRYPISHHKPVPLQPAPPSLYKDGPMAVEGYVRSLQPAPAPAPGAAPVPSGLAPLIKTARAIEGYVRSLQPAPAPAPGAAPVPMTPEQVDAHIRSLPTSQWKEEAAKYNLEPIQRGNRVEIVPRGLALLIKTARGEGERAERARQRLTEEGESWQ